MTGTATLMLKKFISHISMNLQIIDDNINTKSARKYSFGNNFYIKIRSSQFPSSPWFVLINAFIPTVHFTIQYHKQCAVGRWMLLTHPFHTELTHLPSLKTFCSVKLWPPRMRQKGDWSQHHEESSPTPRNLTNRKVEAHTRSPDDPTANCTLFENTTASNLIFVWSKQKWKTNVIKQFQDPPMLC